MNEIIKDGPRFIRLDSSKLRRELEVERLYAKSAPWIYGAALIACAASIAGAFITGVL